MGTIKGSKGKNKFNRVQTCRLPTCKHTYLTYLAKLKGKDKKEKLKLRLRYVERKSYDVFLYASSDLGNFRKYT